MKYITLLPSTWKSLVYGNQFFENKLEEEWRMGSLRLNTNVQKHIRVGPVTTALNQTFLNSR